MKINYILYGFGILLCLSGVGYLAIQYVKYLSELGRLISLLLTIGMFASPGKFFESVGW